MGPGVGGGGEYVCVVVGGRENLVCFALVCVLSDFLLFPFYGKRVSIFML